MIVEKPYVIAESSAKIPKQYCAKVIVTSFAIGSN